MEPKSSPTTAFLLGEQLWNSLQPSDTWEAFNALVSRIAGGVVVYADGPDGRLAYASENLLAMLGYTRAEFDQRYEGRFENLIFPEDRAATLRSIEKQLAERDVDTCTYRMERKDGTPLWVQDEGRTVKDSRGSKAAAARTSSGCSHTQSNSTGATSAVNTPPSAPPADMVR